MGLRISRLTQNSMVFTIRAMKRFCFLMILAGGVVHTESHPLPNPEVLKWQFEAQERERAINRETDYWRERQKRQAEQERNQANAKVVNVDKPANYSR